MGAKIDTISHLDVDAIWCLPRLCRYVTNSMAMAYSSWLHFARETRKRQIGGIAQGRFALACMMIRWQQVHALQTAQVNDLFAAIKVANWKAGQHLMAGMITWASIGRRERRLAAITTRRRMLLVRRRMEWCRFISRCKLCASRKRYLAEVHDAAVAFKIRLDSLKEQVLGTINLACGAIDASCRGRCTPPTHRVMCESRAYQVYNHTLSDSIQQWAAFRYEAKRKAVETIWLRPRGDGARLRRGMRRMRRWYMQESLFTAALRCLHSGVLPRRSWRLRLDALWFWYTEARWQLRSQLLPRRRRRHLKSALMYWSAEARWRIQRHKWLCRQVRYMDELQHVLDNLDDGHKWARRLLSLGLEPQDVAHLGPFHPRCAATLEKALQRSSPSSAKRRGPVRMLSPEVDSYLEDTLG